MEMLNYSEKTWDIYAIFMHFFNIWWYLFCSGACPGPGRTAKASRRAGEKSSWTGSQRKGNAESQSARGYAWKICFKFQKYHFFLETFNITVALWGRLKRDFCNVFRKRKFITLENMHTGLSFPIFSEKVLNVAFVACYSLYLLLSSIFILD